MEQVRRGVRGTALVVSDASDVARGLVGPLRAARIEALRTGQCIEAVALADVVRPQVILVDARLPGSDALCAQLAGSSQPGQALLVFAPMGWSSGGLSEACEVVRYDPRRPETLVERAETLIAEGNDLRAASPLTGLPGNAAIRLELERRLAAPAPVALVYFDLDGFKPYNDRYGFLRGDEVLRGVADLLEREAARRPGTFVGHVGGDDFVLLSTPDDAQAMAERIVAAFDARAPTLYDPEDAERGYLESDNRQGQRVRHPLLTLSVGIASTRHHVVDDPLALVDIATEMKHVAKQREGSAVAVDRRGAETRGPRQRVDARGWMRRHRAPLGAWGRRLALAAAGAVVLTLPGVGVAAASAAPGDRLWPAARALEDVRLRLAGEDGRPALHAELADARIADLLVALSAGDDERTTLAAFEFVRHTHAAGADPNRVGALSRHTALLDRLQTTACDTGRSAACGAVGLAGRALAASVAGSPDATAGEASPSGEAPSHPLPAGGPQDERSLGPPDGVRGGGPGRPDRSPGRPGGAPGPPGDGAEDTGPPGPGAGRPGTQDTGPPGRDGKSPGPPPGKSPGPPPGEPGGSGERPGSGGASSGGAPPGDRGRTDDGDRREQRGPAGQGGGGPSGGASGGATPGGAGSGSGGGGAGGGSGGSGSADGGSAGGAAGGSSGGSGGGGGAAGESGGGASGGSPGGGGAAGGGSGGSGAAGGTGGGR